MMEVDTGVSRSTVSVAAKLTSEHYMFSEVHYNTLAVREKSARPSVTVLARNNNKILRKCTK